MAFRLKEFFLNEDLLNEEGELNYNATFNGEKFKVVVDVNKNLPRLYIDITKTFDKKIKAIKKFKSQWYSIYLLLPFVHLKARLNGLKNNCKYSELFHKIR